MYWHRRDANRKRGIRPTRQRKKSSGGAVATFIAKEVMAEVQKKKDKEAMFNDVGH